MNDTLGLYKILGVRHDATFDQIKAAYRKLAVILHPDKNRGDKNVEEKFKKLGYAYSVLSDPIKRAQYSTIVNTQTPVSEDKNNEPSGTEIIIYGLIILMACFFLTPFYFIGLVILFGLVVYGVNQLLKNIWQIIRTIISLLKEEPISLIFTCVVSIGIIYGICLCFVSLLT